MGACGSTEAGGADQPSMEEVSRSRAIDRLLREEEQRQAREVKMLLLGPGSSGKSTILKQMKARRDPSSSTRSHTLTFADSQVIHLSGFAPSELEAYRQQIFVNVRDGMRAVFQVMEGEELEFADSALAAMAADPTFRTIVARDSQFSVPENLPYFLPQLDRLATPHYQPTDQDVLRCRQKTTGISETTFKNRHMEYRIFDVGGQRSERKKWIHCFENVTAILFLASLAGYDQVLIEDRDSNQMQEALMLFDSICNSQWFVRTSMILFLNKQDVFKERTSVSPISAFFPDYTGPDLDYHAGQEYFKARFTRLNRSSSKEIYTHFTTAVDTSLVKVVMTSVYDIIFNNNLNDFIL
ncbi:G protein alpha subunit [Rhodotorula toruloides]|uniref:G protein alpha subunit n=1 Tax=Rhodotorula toruloides TaxID=5286 RepID=A0A511KEK4_RHOTO|nr:G protein alpha subunit [Rhodotorula toruloides]